jgi:beta-aspartyl-peptidase (threonine type)
MHEAVSNPEGEGATAGLLLMDGESSGAWAFSTPRMARGGWHAGGEAWVEV